MRMFNTAAVDMMSKQSPTFDFAKNMMNPPDQVNTKMGPPPAAVETKNAGNMSQRPMAPSANFGSVGAVGSSAPRPGQGMQFTGPGSSEYAREPPMNSVPVRRPDLSYASGGNGFNESIPSNFNTSTERREMRGPQTTDIENILSGLKTKPVSANPPSSVPLSNDMFSGDDSMISIASLGDLSNGNIPKRTTRKPRKNTSEKNTVSLDI